MSRYINADALIEGIRNTADLGGWIGEALYQIKQVAIKYIDSAPNINIIRCGECEWQKYGMCYKAGGLASSEFGVVGKDDFCSRGERRETNE